MGLGAILFAICAVGTIVIVAAAILTGELQIPLEQPSTTTTP